VNDTLVEPTSDRPQRQLNWYDSTSIAVGIIIGAGIYQTAPGVASSVDSLGGLLGLWLLGGFFSLCGALCYAELATTFPREGGDYVYLSRAYGPTVGFLFGWMQLLVIRPGDIAVIAFTFASYSAGSLAEAPGPWLLGWHACLAVVVLTLINMAGVEVGKWIQNLLTGLKIVGLLAIVALAFTLPPPSTAEASLVSTAGTDASPLPVSVALILVIFTFGGWNETAYVAAEVKSPERNILRALVSGVVAVTILYLLVNLAFVKTLGFERMKESSAIATDTVQAYFPAWGATLVSLLICISALSSLNGLIFTGSRIAFALGADHRLFQRLGRWNPTTRTPLWALGFQAVISLGLIGLLGSFEHAILYTASSVYLFYLATCLGLVILRCKEPSLPRPYRVTAYPLPLLIFGSFCLFLIYSTVTYQPWMAAVVAFIGAVGLLVYAFEQRWFGRTVSTAPAADAPRD
jgi:APA family basic amino acid/polyamine antiporter